MRGGMCDELVSLLDEQGEIPQLAVLHDEIDVRGRLDTVMEGDDVRMPQRLEDLNLPKQVLLKLLVQPGEFDRLDGDGSFGLLQQKRGTISTQCQNRPKRLR